MQQPSLKVEATVNTGEVVTVPGSGWFGIQIGGTYWLENLVGEVIAHQSRAVMNAKCNQLHNSQAEVKEF